MKKSFFIFFIGCFIFFSSGSLALAQDVNKPQITVEIGSFKNFSGEGWSPSGNGLQIDWIGQYIGAIYTYGVGVAAILASVMIMAGGFMWLASAGSPNQISTAKDFIISALAGLLLALFSYIILQGVNPKLVKLEGLTVPTPELQQAAGTGGGVVNTKLGQAPNCGVSQAVADLNSSTWSCVSGVADPRQSLSQGLLSQAGINSLDGGLNALPLDSEIISDLVDDVGPLETAQVWWTLSDETQQAFLDGNVTPELLEQAYTEIDQGHRGGVNGLLDQVTLTTRERMFYSLEQYGSEVSLTALRLLQRN